MPDRKRIEDLRVPNINGLPRGVVQTLHDSIVHIVRMRRSIEGVHRDLEQSKLAAFESCELLKRLRIEGFY